MDKKDLLKRLSGDSFVYSIASISTRLISFILFPFFARQFSPEEYGAIGLLNNFALLLGTFAAMGMDSAAARWFYDSEDIQYRKKAFSSWLMVHSGLIATAYLLILALTAIYPIENLLKADTPLLLVSVVVYNLFAAIPQQIVHLYLVLNRNRVIAMWLSIASAAISAISTLLLVFVYDLGILGFFLGQSISFTICGMWAIFYRLKKIISSSFPGVNFIRPMVKYGASIIPANVSSFLLLFITSIIITSHISQHELGYFQVGYTLATGLYLFTMPFNQAFQPLSFSIMNKPEAGKFFSWVFNFYVILLSCICLTGGLFFPEIVGLLLTKTYLPSDFIAATFLFSNFIYSLSIFALIALGKMKKMQYFGIVVASCNIIILGLVYTGTVGYGIKGAATSFLIGNSITIFFLFYVSRKIYTYPFMYIQNALIILVAYGLFITGYQVSSNNMEHGFGIRLLLMLVFLSLVIFFLFRNRVFVNIRQYLNVT